jgi:hypothetical protein
VGELLENPQFLSSDQRTALFAAGYDRQLYIVGPQRAHSLVYEVARQLGGTAVVAEKFGPTSQYTKDWLKCEFYKIAERTQDEEYRLISGQRSPREQKEYERTRCLCRKIGDFLFGDRVSGDASFVKSLLKVQETIEGLGREGYRLSLPIPDNATVLLVTDKMDEKELNCIVETSWSKPLSRVLLYILCLVTDRGELVVSPTQIADPVEPRNVAMKIISLHQETP